MKDIDWLSKKTNDGHYIISRSKGFFAIRNFIATQTSESLSKSLQIQIQISINSKSSEDKLFHLFSLRVPSILSTLYLVCSCSAKLFHHLGCNERSTAHMGTFTIVRTAPLEWDFFFFDSTCCGSWTHTFTHWLWKEKIVMSWMFDERVARTHHVFNLGEGDLQGDIEGSVCVLHRPQGAGVVLHQVVQKLLGVAALGWLSRWRGRGVVKGQFGAKLWSHFGTQRDFLYSLPAATSWKN